jgi:hypothetical protein
MDQLFGSPSGHWWHGAGIPYEVRPEEQHERYVAEWPLSTDGSRRQIRLLRLHRRLPFGSIRGSMEVYDLHAVPQYDTISYFWGGDALERRILVDGKDLLITKNAYEILHARSSYLRERMMWIDGLCIDQTKDPDGGDWPEKASQIALMYEIYRLSQRTVVWLGYGNRAYFVIGFIFRVAMLRNRYGLNDLEMYEVLGKERRGPEMQAFVKMLDHPWFTRIWVIQEIAVPRVVHVIYGGQYLEWDILAMAIEVFAAAPTSVLLTIQGDDLDLDLANAKNPKPPTPRSLVEGQLNRRRLPEGVQFGQQMSSIRQEIQSGPQEELDQSTAFPGEVRSRGVPLRELLWRCSLANASVPKDKVFALLAMAHPPPSDDLLSMYNADVTEIYQSVSQSLLSQDYLHWVLPLAGIGSWSADSTPRLAGLHPECSPDYWPDPDNPSYAASSGFVRPPSLDAEDGLLLLQGVRTPRIAQLGSHSSYYGPQAVLTPRTYAEIGDQIDEIIAMSSGSRSQLRYGTAEGLKDAIWRTLVGDCTNHGQRPAPRSWIQHFDAILSMLELRRAVGDDEIARDPLKFMKQFEHLPSLQDGSLTRFTIRKGCMGNGRKFAIMEDGALGWVPRGCEVGDEVLVLFGAQVPFAVRRRRASESGGTGAARTTSYELLGECYVHGLMDGEAVLRSGAKVEDFALA